LFLIQDEPGEGILLQIPLEHTIHDGRRDLRNGRGRTLQNCREHAGGAGSFERALARQHFIRPLGNLDGDDAVETSVAGLLHLAHAALADRGKDFVRAEVVADRQRHVSDLPSVLGQEAD
jgi:hypothetical protein